MKIIVVLVKNIFVSICLLISFSLTAFAFDQYNFYDQYGGRTGSARPNMNGGYDVYDQYGNRVGSSR